MTRYWMRYRVVLVLLITAILTTFVLFPKHRQLQQTTEEQHLSNNGNLENLRKYGSAPPNQPTGDVEESPDGAAVPYKQGKKIIYQPRPDCIKPDFLQDYVNPCWVSTQARKNIACSAKVVLLGFQKSGTTDISRWFADHHGVSYTAGDLFKENLNLTSQCPLKWLEDFDNSKRHVTHRNKTAYDDCPGCVLVSQVLRENTTHIIRQSAIQYLQYTMVEESRYIVTMREPADRMISNFFYLHKMKLNNNPYKEYSLVEFGNAFFHKIVMDTTTALKTCLGKYGTTSCILQKELSPIKLPNQRFVGMFTIGCYSTHLKEVLRFIPREKIYFSRMNEYSKNETEVMKEIYRFVGVSTAPLDDAVKSKKNKEVMNAGYKTKPVLPETIETLHKFYLPFNIELATLLDDDKWLWK